MVWRPLLNGSEAVEARREVARIAASLAVRVPRDAALGPSLLAGQAGIALFHGYAHLDDPAAGHLAHAEDWLAGSVDALAAAEHPLSLYTGAAGVAWVAHHLAVRLGTDGGEDAAGVAEAVDEAVLSRVRETPWDGPLDLLHGLAGYGVFVLPRAGEGGAASHALCQVVDRLGELARYTPCGTGWGTEEGGVPDTGVAHGAAGILYALAGAVAKGCNAAKAGRLLAGGIDGLLACAPDHGELRLAWCRGDAGSAVALSAVAGLAGRASLGTGARRMERLRRIWEAALRVAARSPEGSGVEDAALCHGAAGLGHLFNRLHQREGDPRFAVSARFWLAEALRLRRRYPGSGGYPRLAVAPRDFLCGEAGTGLALLAAVSHVAPDWDQLLCARSV